MLSISKKIVSASLGNNTRAFLPKGNNLLTKGRFNFFNNGKYDTNKDYYAILGIGKQADQNQIKKEYYKLAKLYHPDVNSLAQQKFKLINQAYGVLSDQKIKVEYDEVRSSSDAKQRFDQRRYQYQNREDYRRQYYQQYRSAYEEMNEQDRYLIKKQFTRMMIRVFFFGFTITLFFSIFLGPRRMLVDQFGRPVDMHGRPINRYGNPVVYQNQNGQATYDPYNLGGTPRNTYPQQSAYGKQYTSNQQASPPPQGLQKNQNY